MGAKGKKLEEAEETAGGELYIVLRSSRVSPSLLVQSFFLQPPAFSSPPPPTSVSIGGFGISEKEKRKEESFALTLFSTKGGGRRAKGSDSTR